MDIPNAKIISQSVDVDRDVTTVYNQWTQFEEFPTFMKDVESVEQLTDTRLRWTADLGLVSRTWEASIDEQIPDQIIMWRADGEVAHAGKVRFAPLGADRTRVDLQMAYAPESVTEKIGAWTGLAEARIKGDLHRFKDFIESRPTATGAHRDAH